MEAEERFGAWGVERLRRSAHRTRVTEHIVSTVLRLSTKTFLNGSPREVNDEKKRRERRRQLDHDYSCWPKEQLSKRWQTGTVTATAPLVVVPLRLRPLLTLHPHQPVTAAQADALATTTTRPGGTRTTDVMQEEIGLGIADPTSTTGGVTRTSDGLLLLHREGATTDATLTETVTAIKAEQGLDLPHRRRKQEEEETAAGDAANSQAREGGAAVSPIKTRSSPEEEEEVGTAAEGVKSSRATPEVRRRNLSNRTLNRAEPSRQRPSAFTVQTVP